MKCVSSDRLFITEIWFYPFQGHDRVYAEAATTSAECQESNGAKEDCLYCVQARGHWRLVDHLHVGTQYGPVDLQGGVDGIREYSGATKEGHQVNRIRVE